MTVRQICLWQTTFYQELSWDWFIRTIIFILSLFQQWFEVFMIINWKSFFDICGLLFQHPLHILKWKQCALPDHLGSCHLYKTNNLPPSYFFTSGFSCRILVLSWKKVFLQQKLPFLLSIFWTLFSKLFCQLYNPAIPVHFVYFVHSLSLRSCALSLILVHCLLPTNSHIILSAGSQ